MSERVTFGVDAAISLLRLDRMVRDCDGDLVHEVLPSDDEFAPYTLADDEPLTGEQTRSVCVAQPGLCFSSRESCLVRRYDHRRGWQLWEGGAWVTVSGAAPLTRFLYTLAPDPEATQKAPETAGESQRQALPHKTKSLVEVAQHFEAGGAVADRNGNLFRLRDGVVEEQYLSKWKPQDRPLMDLCAPYTLHPADHLDEPEPKPKSGAELRRWMVAHPGRVVVETCSGHGFRWDDKEAAFQRQYESWCGPLITPKGEAVPETGGWGEEVLSDSGDCQGPFTVDGE